MIKLLNEQVKCRLGASNIDGVGVFAIRNIEKGERLYCRNVPVTRPITLDSLDELLPEVRELILQRYPLALEGIEFLNPNEDARLISFMNHSGDPNYDIHNDSATRYIKKGEEITEDYKIATNWQEVYKWLK